MNYAMPHIAAWRRFDGFMFDRAGALRCLALAAAVGVEPLHPAWPPASLVLRRLLEPGVGFLRIRCADPVAASVLRCRIDYAGDVAARAQHEGLVLAAE